MFSADGQQAYSTGYQSIAILDRDPVSGSLSAREPGCFSHAGRNGDGSENGCIVTGCLDQLNSIILSPDGKNLYSSSGGLRLNPGSNAIGVFDRDPVTGDLAIKPGEDGCFSKAGTGGMRQTVVTEDGRHVYAMAMAPGSLLTLDRDTSTGVLTQQSGDAGCINFATGNGGCPVGHSYTAQGNGTVMLSPDERFVYAQNDGNPLRMFSRDESSGVLTELPEPLPHLWVRGISISADGKVASAERGNRVFVLDRDPTTGALRERTGVARCVGAGVSTDGCVVVEEFGMPLVMSPDGQNAYGGDTDGGSLAVLDVAGPCDHPFPDVDPWVDPAVDWLYCHQHMTGFADGSFGPVLDISRGQVARLLYRLAGAPSVENLPPHRLTDVPPWIEDPVRWLVARQYALGFADGTFRPGEPITRGQAVRMVYRTNGSPSGSAPHHFSDVPAWLTDAVNWIADPANTPIYATGYPDGTFLPQNKIRRDELARATCRIYAVVNTC